MRLPPFLRFLEPKLRREGFLPDGLALHGHIRVERQAAGGPLELVHDSPNFIVDVGVTAIRDALIGVNGGGFLGSIFRMAVGDGGVPPGELFNPKLPDATWPARTQIFHEMLRQDISVFETPTTASMRFVTSFNSLDLLTHEASYSLSDRVVNEAALIIGNGTLTVGDDKKFLNDGDSADADEVMVSMRTFKSASFDAAEDVTISVSWTLTIATS
ncbi:MAG: hypothetical protein JRE57_00155 [Deltaproteobacteria bacterium]|nr:hypothetical protein [Deltaproteobacteria bacterium]